MLKYTKISVMIKEKPPYFIGSQIRGALGYALKKVVCINPSFQCVECFAKNNCLYYDFYEKKNEYHKYRLDFELDKEYYDFSIYLFDSSANDIAYIVSAFYTMLTDIGFGRENKTYTDFDIYVNDIKCLIDNKITIPKEFIKEFVCEDFCSDVKIKLTTPLRIKKDNKFARYDIDLLSILSSINRRYYDLIEKDYQRLKIDNAFDIKQKDIEYKQLIRKSNRQKTKMNMDGIVGTIQVHNIDERSYQLLKLGELIGVGKQTVFGLGKIEIEEIKGCK
jgi:CRISPR-associated endoribonuclease Cas6